MHHDVVPLKAVAAVAAVALTFLAGCGEPVGMPVTFTNESGTDTTVAWRVTTTDADTVREQVDKVPRTAARMEVATLELHPGEHRIFVDEGGWAANQTIHVDRSTVEISFLVLPDRVEIAVTHVD